MGKDYFDFASPGHLIGGIVATVSIFPQNPVVSLVAGNLLHFCLEGMEINVNPYNDKILESSKNHLGDNVMFLIGSLIGLIFTRYTVKYPTARWVLLILFIICMTKEFQREYSPWNASNGAFYSSMVD
jgi:hypothetical protein